MLCCAVTNSMLTSKKPSDTAGFGFASRAAAIRTAVAIGEAHSNLESAELPFQKLPPVFV